MRREILEYSRAVCCEEVLGRIDQQMYELAQTWQAYIGFDFVGGGTDFATAWAARRIASVTLAPPPDTLITMTSVASGSCVGNTWCRLTSSNRKR